MMYATTGAAAAVTGAATSASIPDPIASERWNVQKSKAELDRELAAFYDEHTARVNGLRNSSNLRAVEIVNQIFSKMRWASPEWPLSVQRVVVELCHLVLNQVPPAKLLPTQQLYDVWLRKAHGRGYDRLAGEIATMVDELKGAFTRRDRVLEVGGRKLGREIELLVTKHEGRLRWMMERNRAQRDTYWTIWYLAAKGDIADLDRFITQGRARQASVDAEADAKAAATAAETAALAAARFDPFSASGETAPEMPGDNGPGREGEAQGESEAARSHRLASYRLSLRLRIKHAALRAFSVDEPDPDFGRTALHYACRRGECLVVESGSGVGSWWGCS